MMKTVKRLTQFLIMLSFILSACRADDTAVPPNPTNPPSQPVDPTAPPTAETAAASCTAGNPDQTPLYDHQVYLTTSPDGAQFDEPGALILEHASVPDGVIGPDGRLWVYFINGEPGQHGIFAARQSDTGAWEVVDCIKLDGRFEGNAVDPDITRLPDGRYRLVYFLGNFVGGPPPEPGQPHPIYSAISADGINFTIEQQLIAVEGVTDPSLAQLPDGRWLLAMTRSGETLLATSDDGANFELTGVTFNMPGIPELAVLPDGRVRLYLSQSLISADGGQTWTVEEGVQVPGGGADPSLAALPDGGYAFFYKGFVNQPGNPPPDQPGNPPPDQPGQPGPPDNPPPDQPGQPGPPDNPPPDQPGQPGPPDNPPPDQPGQPGPPDNPPPDQPGSPPPTPADSGMAMYANAQSAEALPQEEYLAQVATAVTNPDSAWQYQTTLFATMPAGQQFDLGGFCRIFQRPDGAGYDVIFGGAFNIHEMEEARRYQGDVRRLLGNDLTFQTEPQLFSSHGGDLAIDADGQFYYLLNAHPQGWLLGKYDLDFNLVQEVVVPLPAGHAANDQMLRAWDGRLYLSGLYNPNSDAGPPDQAGPNDTVYTHLWIYDADLNPVADYVLDDAPNINGGTLIAYDDGFAYIAADNFLTNNLYAHLYDASWQYQGSVLLEENAQWSMGGTTADGQIYVAYHRGEHGRGDVLVNIYDQTWNLLDQIQVTAVTGEFNAQRPWVQLYDDTLFVSYDVGRDASGIMDLQCLISVYGRRS